MTESYKKRLLELSKDLLDASEPIRELNTQDARRLTAVIDQLAGYISALEVKDIPNSTYIYPHPPSIVDGVHCHEWGICYKNPCITWY